MRQLLHLTLAAGLALDSMAASSQAVDRRWAHEFTNIAAACERRDGSVIAVDDRDPAIVLLAADGSARLLSRRGNGPGEFVAPRECFAMAGDTVLVHDRSVGRYLLIAPGTNTITTLTRPASISAGWYELRGMDDRGRLVFERKADDAHAIVMRWDRGGNAIDTLMTIPTGLARSSASGTAVLSRVPPFTPRAAVVAGPALGLAIVHAEPFRIDNHRDGASSTGATIPFTRVAVDEKDVEQVIASLAPPLGTTGVSSNGQRVAIPQMQWRLENFGLTRADLPSHKPAFDPRGVFASPSGAVWVRLHQPSAARAEYYEVRTPAGQRGAPVTLPMDRRLTGVGVRAAYVAATDADGIQTLERIVVGR